MQDHADYVVSCGGGGSKLFAKFLHPDLSKTQINTYHLHDRDPAGIPVDGRNHIYLFSDPRDAILSFFKRRAQRHDRHDFFARPEDAAMRARPDPDWVIKHLKNLGGDPASIDPDWDLDDYLRQATQDVFGLEAHLDNWRRAAQDRPVLFVRYETLWQHEDALKALLGRPQAHLPTFIPRTADWRSEPALTQHGLDRLMGGLAARLNALPDIFGRYGTRHIDTPEAL